MKGNKKILVIAILLLLIAVSYGTYAIYKSSISGTANVTAALWAIEFSDGTDELEDEFELTFGAADCVNNAHVADGKIAPGATCTKEVIIDATGTEVDVEYELEVDNNNIQVNGTTKPNNSNNFSASLGNSDGVIMMDDDPQSDTVEVSITWGGEEGENYDPGDTTIGENEWEITVPLTITAKQMIGS